MLQDGTAHPVQVALQGGLPSPGSGGDSVAGLAVGLQPVVGHLADIELGGLLGAATPPAPLRLGRGAPRASLVGRLGVAALQAALLVMQTGARKQNLGLPG